MTDNDFLRSIVAAPDDDFLRLAYADWLQEQGDPRGEFLRVENELRSLPTTDLGHAPLQARLKEFHRDLDPDWLGLVGRLPPLDGVAGALVELEELLPGCDYVVGLDFYHTLILKSATPKEYVRAALGSFGSKAVVGSTRPITKTEMLEEVERCLCFRISDSTGPPLVVTRSRKLTELIGRVREYLDRSFDEATTTMSVRFVGRHPFRGVMWEFAYLFIKPRVAVVFIGWSSD